MGKLTRLKQNWSDADWWRLRVIPFLRREACNSYARAYYAAKGVDFVSIPESDWDNLLILDACRYDYFERQHDLNGELEQRYSKASQTPVFLRKNFGDQMFHDIVYLSGNPFQRTALDDDQFHDVYHLWETHWDDELRTVPPEAVTEVAAEAHDTYPNKRLMVHYMQPHTPFIGSWAREHVEIRHGNQHARQIAQTGTHDVETSGPYERLKRGELKRGDVEKAYAENLDVVLDSVESLLPMLRGKTVVTADHGELLGERAWPFPWKGYEHRRYFAEKLLEVPWLVVETGERKSVDAEPPNRTDETVDTAEIEEKLRNLGYK
jgi:hypothetical protein